MMVGQTILLGVLALILLTGMLTVSVRWAYGGVGQ